VLARWPALEEGRPFPLTIAVALEDLHALMDAAAEGLDARAYVERALCRLASDLRSGRAASRATGGARAATA
jgi:hypothetical protein